MPWTNWVGNQSFSPAAVVHPRDEDEVVRAVREASGGVRVAGAGHSFTPIVETSGTLLDLGAMRGVVSTDAESKRVTALPATLIHDFYEPLWDAGLALRNQGDIDTQQIAGAVATATHGSGIGNPSLSGFVRRVRLVTGSGEIREIGEDEPDLLRAAQVSVGMLGVVTEIELAVTEAYRLKQQVVVWPWEEVLERWDELVQEHRHFGFFWLPTEESGALYNLDAHGEPRRPLLREDLRRGDARRAGRRHARAARGPQLSDLPDGLRPQLPRARVLRAARAWPGGIEGDPRADAGEPAGLGLSRWRSAPSGPTTRSSPPASRRPRP